MRTLIKNGFIVDGSGEKGYYGCVVINDEMIEYVGENPPTEAYERIIDARGSMVCPGFIDTHSHSDLKLLEQPFQAPKLFQGITTEVLGQDGVSMAPLPKEYLYDWKRNLSGLDGESDSISWDYPTSDSYLTALENAGICTNAAYLIPHGNIRMEAMGLTDRKADDRDIERMKEIVRRDMKAGALGISSGLIYTPCTYGDSREITELCKAAAEFDGVFVVHQRSEAEQILSSMDEIISAAKQSGIRLHISHFKACGKKTWGLVPEILRKLDDAKAQGVRLSFDQYPYAAGSTMLSVVMPPWVQAEGTSKMLELLSREDILCRIEKEILSEDCGWDNFFDFAGAENIYITYTASEKNSTLIGKSLAEIAKEENTTPVRAAARLLVEENNAVSMVDFYGLEEHIKLFMARPEQNVCTDGLLSGKPHPRVYGAFPRVLGRYVREQGVLTTEQAVYKMTAKSASALGIKQRGLLRKGYYADIVICNLQTVIDTGDYKDPARYPKGIETVIVNGKIAVCHGNGFVMNSGRVIRKG